MTSEKIFLKIIHKMRWRYYSQRLKNLKNLKNRNGVDLWTNSLKLHTAYFYCIPSWRFKTYWNTVAESQLFFGKIFWLSGFLSRNLYLDFVRVIINCLKVFYVLPFFSGHAYLSFEKGFLKSENLTLFIIFSNLLFFWKHSVVSVLDEFLFLFFVVSFF